ncbi:hypothetical protein [Caproicibacterium amylolyticum]|uniref:Uncharacterized protein n=1 Tax=Caproicibacterium amylolyticum TaxID=2766537 RepID=A0A7G9WDY8_9FIRM|nr:hypothetical protein [Caproicibacterium amylolyticum]QNO16900.1 hypothetical protein H6X83_07930 [Caproicibacterium amylolyticum]
MGDVAAHMLPFAGTHYCVVFICNLDEYYNSWEKMISAGAKQIFPAHGEPFPVDKLAGNIHKNKSENLVFY